MTSPPHSSTLFPYTTLFRSLAAAREALAHTPELLPRLREAGVVDAGGQGVVALLEGAARYAHGEAPGATETDRKSTRLNSSHMSISYAVFCLKKKKKWYGIT